METRTETTTVKANGTAAPVVVAPKKRNYKFIIILAILVIGGGAFGITKFIHGQHHEETDDAQVEANISPVIPRVTGYLKEIRVTDNENVKKGDTLVILDNSELKIRLEQAEAALATAESNLHVAQATSSA